MRFRQGIEIEIKPDDTPREVVKTLLVARRMYTMVHLGTLDLPNLRAAFLADPNKISAEDMLGLTCRIPQTLKHEDIDPSETCSFIAPIEHSRTAAYTLAATMSYVQDYLEDRSLG